MASRLYERLNAPVCLSVISFCYSINFKYLQQQHQEHHLSRAVLQQSQSQSHLSIADTQAYPPVNMEISLFD